MDLDGFDQTQAIALDDYSDDTDDLGDPENKQPVGHLKVFSQKSFKETSFPVFEGDNFIGRHESNQICIPLKALSKRHACIEIQGDSHLIYDMESRNKTRRGKLFLKPSVRYELHDDDSLIFGDVTCQFIRVEKKCELESDDGSETDSELMFQDLPRVGEKEADVGSSSSYDVVQPTQAYETHHVNKEKKIILETPQRESATLIFAEASDENIPTEPVKACADNSVCHLSIQETPVTKPLAESTVITDSYDEDERNEQSDLDVSTLALAPTQAYGQFADLETQAYPTVTDSDPEEEEVRQSLFDAPTQAFTVPDSEDEDNSFRDKRKSRSNKRISLAPTLLLNLSTDDESKTPERKLASDHHDVEEEATMAYSDEAASESEEHPQGAENEVAAFADLAAEPTLAYTTEEDDDEVVNISALAGAETQAYATTDSDSDHDGPKVNTSKPVHHQASTKSSVSANIADEPTLAYEENDEGANKEEGETLAFADLATQAFCPEESDEAVDIPGSKNAPMSEPTLKYDMQPATLQDVKLNQAEAETLTYIPETESDRDQGAEPTLKYDMGVVGGKDGDEVDLAAEPTLAYTTEEDDDEVVNISALAGAETQAYATTDSDSDHDGPKVNTSKPVHHQASTKSSVSANIADEPTLAYEENDEGANKEEGETLAFADLATQAFCPEESDEAVDIPGSKNAPMSEPTLKYDMQPATLQDVKLNQAEAETLTYIPETESDRDQGAEPTLKYDMGVVGGKDEDEVDLAAEPTLAYTTEEDDDEVVNISALAGAETQAYATTDPDPDHDGPKVNTSKPVHHQADTKSSVSANIADEPTLAYEENDEPPKTSYSDEATLAYSNDNDKENDEPPKTSYSDEATLAYSNDDDESMDTDMSLDDGEAREITGLAEMETQPAGDVESELDGPADPSAPTVQYNAAEVEDDDDTTMATQAYGLDTNDDDEANPDTEEKPSSSLLKQQLEVKKDEMDERKEELNEAENDFTSATQVYGADEESETQVPDSQEGVEEEEGPLVGLTHSVSCMLRKVPERSAMASPEKKQPQRVRRVAFKEQTPPDEELTQQEENKATRKSARGRKPKVKEPVKPTLTETDAKPTRRKSKDLSLPDDASRKRKGSRDVVEGEVKSADGDSEESTLKVKEDQGLVWKSTGGLELREVNNNILDKPAARRTSRRQASYKKAVHDEDSDDTESMSSTSSLQVAVGEPSGRSVEALGISEVTVCDGKSSEDVVKPRRGRRSNASKVAASKASNISKAKGKNASSVTTDPESSSMKKVQIIGTGKNIKLKISLNLQESESDKVPEAKQSLNEDNNSSSKGTRSTRGKKAAGESQQTEEVKETAVSARRGRKPKTAAKTPQEDTTKPQGKGQKHSSITDYVVAEDTGRLTNTPSMDRNLNVQDKQTKQYKERHSLPSTDSQPSRSRRAKTSSGETVTKPSTTPSAKQEAFLAPEPVRKGGCKRRGARDDDQGQGSDASHPDTSPLGTKEKEEMTEGKVGKRGKKTAVLETPQKEEQPLTTPSNNRRGKRSSTPTLSTPTGSPSTKKVNAPETPEGEVASPSLRRRPSDIKPKVMFTGVIDKSWQKIVSSLGGKLVESVFDCTHLVTDKVRRTVKFLCCLSRGALIVVPDWLDQCKVNKTFVDPAPYLVKDKAAEKQHGFTHVTSHQRALQGGVMTKYRVFVTGSVKPEPQQMKEIILCAGGKFLSSLPVKPDPYTIIISCEEDKAKCQSAIKAGLQIVSAEFILTGMLRQEIQPELYQLFTSTSTTTSERGTKRKVNDAPSSSKRKR